MKGVVYVVTDAAVLKALEAWRSKLVDLSRRNRLLSFKAQQRGVLKLVSPEASVILRGIRGHETYAIRGTEEGEEEALPRPDRPTLIAARSQKDVTAGLRGLKRKADEQFLERGLSVLYLAFGILHWEQEDGTQMSSPLLLVPSALKGSGLRSPLELTAGADEDVLNPALMLALEERGADLSLLPDPDDADIDDVVEGFSAMLRRIEDFDSWSIERSAFLAAFDFKKEAMYKDLHDNQERISAHPIVRALATSNPLEQTDAFTFEPLSAMTIDETAPPEDMPLVLDADSSQRVAIAAARAGRSFVMDGPPGTGKSQTIANMIATLMYDGKTVLFVSEKVAALDVVRKRLQGVDLESFLFDIHSANSSRKAVADELATTLAHRAQPPQELDGVRRSTLVARRRQLNSYAEASNEKRSPLQQSVHEVLGRLALLTDAPKAPDPELSTRSLSDESLARILGAATNLSRNWRPARQASVFHWRGVTTTRQLDREIDAALHKLAQVERLAAEHHEALTALDLGSFMELANFVDAASLAADVADRETLRTWLTADDLDGVRAARADLGSQLESAHHADNALHAATGRSRTAFSDPALAPPAPSPRDPSRFPRSTGERSGRELVQLIAGLERQASELEERLRGVRELAAAWGLPEVATYQHAEAVRKIVSVRDRELYPDARWFTPQGYQEARQAATALEQQSTALAATAAAAGRHFTPAIFNAPLTELQHRFDSLHTGLLRHFSAEYKADKRVVEELLQDATRVKDGIDHLGEAIAWTSAVQQMEQSAAARSGILGQHWKGPQTDYRRLYAALDAVSEVAAMFPSGIPAGVVAYLAGDTPNLGARAVVESARQSFAQWVQRAASHDEYAGRPELVPRPIDDSIRWLRDLAEHLVGEERRIRWAAESLGRDLTGAEAESVIELVARAYHEHRALTVALPSHRETLGSSVGDDQADLPGLDLAIERAGEIRELLQGRLHSESVRSFLAAGPVDGLQQSLVDWRASRDRFFAYFDEGRRLELVEDAGDPESARDILEGLNADQLGMQEWMDFVQQRDILREAGLGAAFEFCCANDPDGEQVPRIIERSILRAWVEDLIEDDERLSPLGAAEKEVLVSDFRELDTQLVLHTAGTIITAANRRRPPNIGTGEPGLIRQQGSRKRKHMAARDLISQARGAVQGLKPVFMMSPLAVSQYLPPDISFDVVIFDEASQVTPEDAINCIYRGRNVILAGDEKQLPPTSFFERSVEAGPDDEDSTADLEDFESVLELAKGSGAFPNLGLRWHYRSKHESLIAYSNYKFYRGDLITFPSAQEYGDTLGVSFHLVEDGVYERGGSTSNPKEAQAVARRVIEHFRSTPDVTLGVVTFSVAQQDAIDTAIRAELASHPDLEKYFDDSNRLGGFFVRSLESVQGDERDVIFFSVGYGPDEAGKITTVFGPLNRKGGGRRLNVGITRARRAVVVFASMTGDRIPPTLNENVELLRNYLEFAARGLEVLAVPASPTGLDPESPFEDSVIQRIRDWGYDVEPQVGAAGYRVDIGVRHPDRPGRFVLGVECDGFQYHSAPAARDRDRLRDSILVGLGWTMYRIWGTAWYRHREHEEEKLKAAIEAAIAGEAVAPRVVEVIEPPVLPVVTQEAVSPDEQPLWVTEYQEAPRVELPWSTDPSDADSASMIAHGLTALARSEGPVHMSIVRERVRDWWNLGSVGSRVKRNIEMALREHSRIRRDGEFLYLSELQIRGVRVPSDTTRRKVDEVHLDELALAVELSVKDAGSSAREEIVRHVRAIFGWQRTGDQIAVRLDEAIDRAIELERVRDDGGRLRITRGVEA